MNIISGISLPVTRTTRQSGFKNYGKKVSVVTFGGEQAVSGSAFLPHKTHVMNKPSQIFFRKDGMVTIVGGDKTITIRAFVTETIKFSDGEFSEWNITHMSEF